MTVETCVKRMKMFEERGNHKEAEFWRERGLGKLSRHPKLYFGERKEKLLKELREEKPKEEDKGEDLSKRNKVELQSMLEAQGIPFDEDAKKKDLIKLIEANSGD